VTQRSLYVNVIFTCKDGPEGHIAVDLMFLPSSDAEMTDDEMTIREMCDAFDVTPRTLRFYEAKELLFPRREGQKRLFTRRDRARLKLILRGKRFGFSLEEIRQLLDLYYVGDQQATQLEATLDVARERLKRHGTQARRVDGRRRRPARADEDGRGHAVRGRHRQRRRRISAAREET
jgi:DNA-binding transcriptional MerR regulator